MRKKSLLILLAASSVTVAAAAAAPAIDPDSELPIKEFMGHVMQRNAEQLWHWTASESDEKGEHSGRPVSEEEWENAESDALTLQQLTYALEHSRYRVPDERWDRHLAAFRTATNASAAAAERKDFAGLEAAGDAINDQCIACHTTFAPEIEAPPPPLPASF